MTEIEEAVFQRAFHAYKNARYQEVVDILEGVSTTVFERDQWAHLNCNILVCKMEKLRRTSQLAEVLEGFREMWQRIKGFPARAKSLLTELATCCNACQAIYCLWQGGATHCLKEGIDLSEEAIVRGTASVLVKLADKLSQGYSPEENTTPPFDLLCLMKLALLQGIFLTTEGRMDEAYAIHHSITTILGSSVAQQETVDQLSSAMRANLVVEMYVHMSCNEDGLQFQLQEAYLEAWQAYQSSRYGEALCSLQSVLKCTYVPLVAMGRLLAGCCYMRQNKLQLALCSFQGCLRSPACLLPAIHNCVQVFRLLGNEEAEFDFRLLLIEALERMRFPEIGGRGRMEEDWKACSPQSLAQHLLQVQYSSALRALQCKRYRTCARLLQCIIDVMRQGNEPLPQDLPPPTKLHLLLAHSLMSCGEYHECKMVADQLISALDPSIPAEGGGPAMSEGVLQGSVVSMVTLLQSIFIKGCALQCEGQAEGAQLCYQRILKITDILLPRLLASPEACQVALHRTEDLKVSTLNNLAVVAMTRAEHCQSFALVVQALACPRGVCVVTMANYVQLLLKQGKKAEAYTCWLQYREKVPTDASGGTNMLKEARAFGGHSDERKLDVEALSFWVRQNVAQNPRQTIT